jgi:hypothetical protein
MLHMRQKQEVMRQRQTHTTSQNKMFNAIRKESATNLWSPFYLIQSYVTSVAEKVSLNNNPQPTCVENAKCSKH